MSTIIPNKITICYISCLLELQDSHNILFIETLASYGYRIIAIMPDMLCSERLYKSKISHVTIPIPTYHFDSDSGIIHISRAIFQRARNFILVARELVRIKPGVCLCQQPDSWLLAVLAKLSWDCKVVVDLLEMYEDRAQAFPRMLRIVVRYLIRNYMIILSKYTDEIIHTNRARQKAYSYLHKEGIVISYFPKLEQFPIQEITQKETLNSRSEEVSVIHAGALRSGYAADELLRAMHLVQEEIPNIRFIVIGGVVGKIRNNDLMKNLIGRGLLVIKQPILFEEMPQYLIKSDIGLNLVLPISNGNILASPRKLYEYLAAGLPVVGADVPTIREVIERWNCGVVVSPESPEDIARGIAQIARDENLRIMMSRNARRAAEEEYNWENEGKKLDILFSSLLDKAYLEEQEQ